LSTVMKAGDNDKHCSRCPLDVGLGEVEAARTR
jgi:hypothetical protein